MGKSITLATLRSDIRFEFDIDPASSRITDAQLTRLINRQRDALMLYILDCSAHYMDAVSTLDTIAGVEFVSLPERFHALTSLRLRLDDDCSVVLRAATEDEVRYDRTARAWTESRPVYWVAQNLMYFWPVPSGVYTLDVAYVQGFGDLVEDADPWLVQPGWDRWVVLQCLLVLWRRQRNAEAFQLVAAELNTLSAQIESALSGPDRNSPPMARRLHATRDLVSLDAYADEVV